MAFITHAFFVPMGQPVTETSPNIISKLIPKTIRTPDVVTGRVYKTNHKKLGSPFTNIRKQLVIRFAGNPIEYRFAESIGINRTIEIIIP